LQQVDDNDKPIANIQITIHDSLLEAFKNKEEKAFSEGTLEKSCDKRMVI